jgi:flagellar protein FlaG
MEIDLAQSGFNANLAQNSSLIVNRVNEELKSESEGSSGRNTDRSADASSRSVSRLNTAESPNVSSENADNIVSEEVASQDIEAAVGEVRDFVQSQRRNLDFSFSPESNQPVVQVTDTETGELIRQIPSEEVLALSDRIRGLQSDVGEAVGVLFSREV